MNVDDFVKIIFSVSGCFAIVGIAIQIMRLLGGVVQTIHEANHTVGNVNLLTDKIVDDYDFVSTKLKSVVGAVSDLTTNVVVPLTGALGFVKKLGDIPVIGRFMRAKDDQEDNEE